MTTISDEQLLEHASRIQGKVLLITGGGSGIGRATALLFAKHGAKVVIGDIDPDGAAKVVAEIIDAGGEAASTRCDVTKWDDQVALFELAKEKFGGIDVVIPNAGILFAPPLTHLEVVDGKPIRPDHKLIDINIYAVLDTCSLAFHYIPPSDPNTPDPNRLKAIVFLASMASFQGIPTVAQYSTSKHAILGLMSSLRAACEARGIRIGSVHPWFVATAMTDGPIEQFVKAANLPFTPLDRVTATILCVATHPDKSTSGLPWTLPDGGPVYRLNTPDLTEGVYAELNWRAKRDAWAIEELFLGRPVVPA